MVLFLSASFREGASTLASESETKFPAGAQPTISTSARDATPPVRKRPIPRRGQTATPPGAGPWRYARLPPLETVAQTRRGPRLKWGQLRTTSRPRESQLLCLPLHEADRQLPAEFSPFSFAPDLAAARMVGYGRKAAV